MNFIELGELFAAEASDLFFCGRDNRIGMTAEENLAQTLARQEPGRSAFDFQLLDTLALLALEFVLGKRSVAGKVGHQFENAAGKFSEPRGGNRAGIGARLRAETSAHAAQVFFDEAARARGGAGANDSRR